MSILIKGISLDEFADYDHDGIGYLIGTGQAVEVPTPHGRLIDADEVIGEINNRVEAAIKWGVNAIADRNDEIRIRAEQAVATFCEASLTVKKMPTIIEAEEETHYGDICDNCVDKDSCDMAKSCDHNPPITSCYGQSRGRSRSMKKIDTDNLVIRQKDKVELQRHQVLVLETNRFLAPEDKAAFRQDVLNQIESGLVILPSWVKALTVDADAVVIM